MFKKARLKLTGLYLFIVFIITIAFSGILYADFQTNTIRAIKMHEERIENRIKGVNGLLQPPPPPGGIKEISINEIRSRFITVLIILNSTILLIAGLLAYWFAGITLRPIECASNKQKKFIADAAHEFKTPLTAMRTNLEVNLRKKDLNLKQAKEILLSSIKDLDDLNDLANILLKESSLESLGTKFVMEDVNLKDIINSVFNLLKPRIEERKIKLINNIKEDCMIKGDQKLLKELVMILVDNAIKFNKESGEIAVDINKQSTFITLIIKDTGIGIGKKYLQNIFDRFYKIETSRSKKYGSGFGLGLSIAKEIVDKHKGEIRLDSKVNEFTLVSVKFPIKN